jgi:predicted HTH domain antitoxin
MIPASAEKNSILIHIGGDPLLKSIETELKGSTAGIIDELAEEFHIGRSALLTRIIEDGLQAELVKRSVRLYTEEKVSMWKAAQLAGISFYEMMTEIKRHGVPLQYGVEDFEADIKTLRKLKSDI